MRENSGNPGAKKHERVISLTIAIKFNVFRSWSTLRVAVATNPGMH